MIVSLGGIYFVRLVFFFLKNGAPRHLLLDGNPPIPLRPRFTLQSFLLKQERISAAIAGVGLSI